MLEKRPLPPGAPKPVPSWPFLTALIVLLAGLGVLVLDRAEPVTEQVAQVERAASQPDLTETRAPVAAPEPETLDPPIPVVSEPPAPEPPVAALPTAEPPTTEPAAAEPAATEPPATTDRLRRLRGQAFDTALESLARHGRWITFVETYSDKLIFDAEEQAVAVNCPNANAVDQIRIGVLADGNMNQPWLDSFCAAPNLQASRNALAARWSTYVQEQAAHLMEEIAPQLTMRPEMGMYAAGVDFEAAFRLVSAQVRTGALTPENAGALLTLRSISTGDTFEANRRQADIVAAGSEDLNALIALIGTPLKK